MDSKLLPWLPAIAAIAGVFTFAATTLAYFNTHKSGAPGSYAPFITGTLVFITIVGAVSHAAAPAGKYRFWRIVVSSVVGAAFFAFTLLFVLLNILGS